MTMTESKAGQKLPLMALTAMVVGSMVGADVFSLPRHFAQATGGAVIAWVVVGVGMLMLAFVFQTLAVRKRELDAGIAYAKAGRPRGQAIVRAELCRRGRSGGGHCMPCPLIRDAIGY